MKYVLLVILIIMAGCASNPQKVTSIYQDPGQYLDLSCTQLNEQHTLARKRVLAVSYSQRQDRTDDLIWGIGGAIFFLPAMLLMNGNDETVYKLAKAKGEVEAIDIAAARANCALTVKTKVKCQDCKKSENWL
ncbi:hypothetical protein LCGC14_2201190 [marine sediment metagenome]|uniref:Lipoprotein n=1 Tax=marine sediment metagenome TaxID=412755 RepID=A0A0F9DGT7_9ZZZZ